MYASEAPTELRQIISVSARYITYGLKMGQIRVLHRETGQRTLIKFHEPPLTNVKCAH